jgi:polyketide cyclase/dehydrase/lipid transport protein
VRTARAQVTLALAPGDALALWTDVRRWSFFVEGFARVLEVSPEWPEEGSRLVWESTPAGRGRVTEKVLGSGDSSFSTRVFDKSLAGTQTLRTQPAPDGSRMELSLEYELTRGGPLSALADLIFIRRALRDSLRRTLRRFAVEAEEEAGLR